MATTVDTLLVRVEADLQDVKRKLNQFDKTVKNTADKSTTNFNKIASVAKTAFAAAIVVQAARAGLALVKFASGVEEMKAKSSVVFGEFVHEVRSDLEQFGNSVGRSTHELEGMASSIQDTFVPMGFARGDAAQLSVQLTKLAVDVASFNNASDTATMEAFQSALVGNHETVRRFGIVITEGTLQQELYRMGLNKTSQEATNAEKVQARLNLIMAGVSDANGDAARTADSFANQSKALTAALEELAVNVLTPMLPALAGIVTGLVDATAAMNDFLDSVGIIDLDPIATKSQKFAEKQVALAEAQERLAYWTRISNGEFENLFERGAGPTLIKNGIEGATKEIQRLRAESQALFADLQKSSGASLSNQGRSFPKKDDSEVAERDIKLSNAITAALDKQRFANAQLADQMAGVSQARIEAQAAANGLKQITAEEVKELEALIALNIENQAISDAKAKLDAEEVARNKSISDTIKQLDTDNQVLALSKMGLTEAEKQLAEITIQMGGLNAEQEEQLQKLIAENLGLAEAISQATNATDAYNKKVAEGEAIANSFKPEVQKVREQIAALDAAFIAGKVTVEDYARAQEGLAMKLAETDPMFKAFKDGAEKAGNAVADSLADGLVEGKIALDDFRGIFKSFIRDLIAEAIKTYIIKRLLAAAFGGFAGGGSVNDNGFTDGGQFSGLAGGGNIPRRATGGPVLVGERGPELFIPHSGGVIKNNMDTKNMLGGGKTTIVNQTLNIETGVSQTVRAEITSLLPQIKQNTIAAVIDQRRRGGSLANAFGA